jgi:hypothetical protein
MTATATPAFDRLYQAHLKHLKLKGLQPKTIDAYARALRRVGDCFDYRLEAPTEAPDHSSAAPADQRFAALSAALGPTPHFRAEFTAFPDYWRAAQPFAAAAAAFPMPVALDGPFRP